MKYFIVTGVVNCIDHFGYLCSGGIVADSVFHQLFQYSEIDRQSYDDGDVVALTCIQLDPIRNG